MQGLKVLPTIADEIARVKEIVDGQTHIRTENRTHISNHASRCDNKRPTGHGSLT